MIQWRVGLCFALAALSGFGCAHRQHECVPSAMTRAGPLVDLSAPPGENRAVDQSVVNQLLDRDHPNHDALPPSTGEKRYQILAMSGGAVYGAYTVGVLNGWTRTGERPNFDVVTGISTGGLIATLAFLGPANDGQLAELYTTITSDDVYHNRPKIALLWSDSAASSKPLKNMIDSQIDCNILQQVASAHSCGRRLYIGTTDLDTKKLAIWDMGAIASSGRPDALQLYRKIVLASASVPGFFPPIPIEVTVNGQRFTEWHCDGGTTSQVFIPGAALNVDQASLQAGRKPLAGSSVYVVLAGKLFADPECVQPKLKNIAGNALTALTSAQTRNDMIRIWTFCKLTGMSYNSTAIPQNFDAPTNSLDFEPGPMRRLFEEGMRQGMAPRAWRTTPPGTEASEQFVPRSGTDFLAPVVECAPPRVK